MEKKKLCLVIPSLQCGGMERVMSELAFFLNKNQGLEVILVLYGKSPELFYNLPENLIIHKPVARFDNRLRLLFTIGRLNFLRQTIKKINPSYVLSFGELWNSFVLLALWGLHLQVYISDRCSPAKKFGIIHSLLRKWLYPRAKGIIAQTEMAKKAYCHQFRHDNICVIGNPIRISSSLQPSVKKENIVLSVGRLIESKNHDKLIGLFCEINKSDWKLVIVGGDALNQNNKVRLKNLISSLNADSKVILTGYSNNIDMYYQNSRIFAFTSDSEGFPNVIGEAMAAGLAVVSFDCTAGPSEMISDKENGFLIPLHDYSLFRERLEQLMSDGQLRTKLGSKARDSIQDYTLECIGKKYYDFIVGN